jgi:membrane associated rhomboid family serine protease
VKAMEQYSFGGFGGFLISFLSAILAWISIKDAQVIVAFCASVVAIISGVMAIRYYYFATKEKKQNLKQ